MFLLAELKPVKRSSPCLLSDMVNSVETVVGDIREHEHFYYCTETGISLMTTFNK